MFSYLRNRKQRVKLVLFSENGLGICEDTAAFIGPDDMLEVVGSGSITVVDPSGLKHSSMADARIGEAITLIGLTLHMLSSGAKFDLNTREAFPK